MMKKTLENRQSFTRRLMQLLVLMAMLLAPKGAWAEDYGLTVAGVAVTSDNASSITGQNISEGTVSYTPKTGTTPAMLTLNGADILGEIVSSVDEDLTIMVIGVNTITTSYNHAIIGKSGGTHNNLRLAYNGNGNGVQLRINGLSSIDELPLNWTSCTKIWKTLEFGENEEGLNPDLCDWYTKEKCGFISIAPSTKYDVWIGGIQLTSNHDSSDGVSFSEYKLTLENATIAPTNASGIEYKGTKDLIISLIGNSSIQTTGSNEAIRYGGAGTDTPKLSFAHDNSGFPCSLQLSSASVSVISSGFSSIEGVNGINQINSNDNKLGLTPTNPLQYGANGLVTTDETPAAVTSVKFGTPFETYGVSVAGTSVTSDNYHDVLNDGTVSFNSQTNTLTLNNATIDMSQKTGYPIESSITNLNVKLIGSSVLTPNSTSKSGIHYTGSESNPTVTLNADNSSYCLLKVNGVSDLAAMFSGYTNSNSIDPNDGVDGWRSNIVSGDNPSVSLEYIDYYDLTVAGVPVTCKNATNIQGENIKGSVSYNKDMRRFVLDGATISGGIVWNSSDDLYVYLNGDNSISGGEDYAIKSTDDTMSSQWIYFYNDNSATNATITLTNNTQNDKTGTIGGGFDDTKHYDLYLINDNNESSYTTIISSYTVEAILPAENEMITVMPVDGTYYSYIDSQTEYGINAVPGQHVSLNVHVSGNLAYNLKVTNTVTNKEVETTSKENGDTDVLYTFVMPSDPVTVTANVVIDISNEYYTASIADTTYTGEPLVPTKVTLTPEEGDPIVLTNGSDFTITQYQISGGAVLEEGESAKNAGTYIVTITGKGNYTGTTTTNYKINKANIPSGKYTVPTEKTGLMTYTGADQALVNAGSVDESLKDEIVLKYYYESISKDEYEGAEYSFLCEPSDGRYLTDVPTEKNAGYYAIVYKFFGGNNYKDIPSTGLMRVAIDSADIANATIEEIADSTYTGKAIKPNPTVTFGQTPIELTANTDYTVAYTNNVNVGKATFTITGKGNFKGTKSKDFNIVNKTLDVTFAENQTWASFYNTTEDFNLPSNVMAYIVTEIGQNSVTVAPINYVPKNVAVLLENNTTTTDVTNTSATGNLLQGVGANGFTVPDNAAIYALYNNKMMRVASGTTIPAGKCYLVVGGVVNAGAPQLNIVFENEGNTTGINASLVNSEEVKGDLYDLQGRKVVYPKKKGLYIQKGRKVVVNNK